MDFIVSFDDLIRSDPDLNPRTKFRVGQATEQV